MPSRSTEKTNSRILTETICHLSDVPKLLPTRVGIATVYRWAKRGVKGQKLETYAVGQKYLTSHEAVHRFLEAIQR